MPWRFFGVLFILILFVLFAGFNIDYRTNISFGFYVFENVPIFLSLLISFVLGALITVPLLLKSQWKKKKSKEQQVLIDGQDDEIPVQDNGTQIDKKKKKSKKKK